VVTAEPQESAGLVERFDPDIVIGRRFEHRDRAGVRAWIELSLDPTQSTKVRVNGKYSEMINPNLEELLAIIEEVAQLARTNDLW